MLLLKLFLPCFKKKSSFFNSWKMMIAAVADVMQTWNRVLTGINTNWRITRIVGKRLQTKQNWVITAKSHLFLKEKPPKDATVVLRDSTLCFIKAQYSGQNPLFLLQPQKPRNLFLPSFSLPKWMENPKKSSKSGSTWIAKLYVWYGLSE